MRNSQWVAVFLGISQQPCKGEVCNINSTSCVSVPIIESIGDTHSYWISTILVGFLWLYLLGPGSAPFGYHGWQPRAVHGSARGSTTSQFQPRRCSPMIDGYGCCPQESQEILYQSTCSDHTNFAFTIKIDIHLPLRISNYNCKLNSPPTSRVATAKNPPVRTHLCRVLGSPRRTPGSWRISIRRWTSWPRSSEIRRCGNHWWWWWLLSL